MHTPSIDCQCHKPPCHTGAATKSHHNHHHHRPPDFSIPENQNAADSSRCHGGDKGRCAGLVELNVRDPWPADHPLRNLCDDFMQMINEAYAEVLDERGLKTHGDGQAVIVTEDEVPEICRAVAAKLAANPKALELMKKLDVHFENAAAPPPPPEGGSIPRPDGTIDMEAWQKRYDQMVANDDYSSLLRLIKPGGGSPMIPGLGYISSFSNTLSGRANSYYDMIRYDEYFRQVHDQVVEEMGLDPAQMEEGSPEALEAMKRIGEKIMADPAGQQLLANAGLTHVNHLGLPSAPGVHQEGEAEPTLNPTFAPENEDQPKPVQTDGPARKKTAVNLYDLLKKSALMRERMSTTLFLKRLMAS